MGLVQVSIYLSGALEKAPKTSVVPVQYVNFNCVRCGGQTQVPNLQTHCTNEPNSVSSGVFRVIRTRVVSVIEMVAVTIRKLPLSVGFKDCFEQMMKKGC